MVFNFLCGTISRKLYKTEPMSQIITNRKSYMGFRFMQTSMTSNDLEQSKCIYAVTGNGRNVRLMLVSLPYLQMTVVVTAACSTSITSDIRQVHRNTGKIPRGPITKSANGPLLKTVFCNRNNCLVFCKDLVFYVPVYRA